MQCRRCLPVGRPADVRSDASTPKHRCATCSDPFGSPSIGCGNRADSRLGRGSAAFVPGAQWGAACLESPSWSFAGQWTGARSSPRRGGPSGKAKADAAGLRISLAAVEQPDVADRPADRSWCTVGSLVGFAFRPRQSTELIHGSEGAPARPGMNGPCHRRASAGLVLRGYASALPVGPVLPGFALVRVPFRCGRPSKAVAAKDGVPMRRVHPSSPCARVQPSLVRSRLPSDAIYSSHERAPRFVFVCRWAC